MTTIKCRKCGKVYPFEEYVCPVCGYDIREDDTLSPRDRAALGKSGMSLSSFNNVSEEDRERWESQTREERQKEAWENRKNFGIRLDQSGLPRLNIPMNTMIFATIIMIIFVIIIKMM